MTNPGALALNSTNHYPLAHVPGDGQNFFHHLNKSDEAAFVALILLGVVVPVIFISVFLLICIRRHKEKKARRAEMLLRDVQDLAMDEYPYMMRERQHYI